MASVVSNSKYTALDNDSDSDSDVDGSPLKRKASGDSDTETEEAPPTKDNTETKDNAETVEILRKKPRNAGKPFSEDMLTGRLGISSIYDTFPKTCRLRGRGFEGSDLKRLISSYAGWAWQLYPGMAFPDLLNRINVMGAKGSVRAVLGNLRDEERDRYLREVMGIVLPSRNGAADTEGGPLQQDSGLDNILGNLDNDSIGTESSDDSSEADLMSDDDGARTTQDANSPEFVDGQKKKLRKTTKRKHIDSESVSVASSATAPPTVTSAADDLDDEACLLALEEAERLVASTQPRNPNADSVVEDESILPDNRPRNSRSVSQAKRAFDDDDDESEFREKEATFSIQSEKVGSVDTGARSLRSHIDLDDDDDDSELHIVQEILNSQE